MGNTFNTAAEESERIRLRAFRRKSRKLSPVRAPFPGLTESIQSYYVPLPYVRDYIGSDDGSLYGIAKDYRILENVISPEQKSQLAFHRTNLNLHGVMGVAMSSVVTCSELLHGVLSTKSGMRRRLFKILSWFSLSLLLLW